jgi:hypothetical protein
VTWTSEDKPGPPQGGPFRPQIGIMHSYQLIFVYAALWSFILLRLAYDELQHHLRYGRRNRLRRRRG